MNMDYKDTLLSNLESLINEAISEDEITPTQIYDCISKTVKDSYYYHKNCASSSYELMTKFNNHNSWEEYYYPEEYSRNRMTYQDYINAGYQMTADGFWIKEQKKSKEKYKPYTSYYTARVELDPASGEYYMSIPSSLLQTLHWKEGDDLTITLQDDKSLKITGPNKPKQYYTDGFSVSNA